MARMTWISMLAAGLLATSLVIFDAPAEVQADDSKADAKKLLIGTWKLKDAEYGGSGIGTRLKFFTGTHWCVIQPDPDTGEIIFQHGGRYTFDGKSYNETIDFAGETTSDLIGKTLKFQLEVTKDGLKQIDESGVYNELWEREQPSPSLPH